LVIVGGIKPKLARRILGDEDLVVID